MMRITALLALVLAAWFAMLGAQQLSEGWDYTAAFGACVFCFFLGQYDMNYIWEELVNNTKDPNDGNTRA